MRIVVHPRALFAALALAGTTALAAPVPVAVQISDPGDVLVRPVQIEVGDGATALKDDGEPPDVAGGDRVWSGTLSLEMGDLMWVQLQGGDGARWSTEVAIEDASEGSLSLTVVGLELRPGMYIVPTEQPQRASSSQDGHIQTRWMLLAWALAAFFAGCTAALLSRRILPPVPPSLPGPTGLPVGLYQVPPERAGEGLNWLLREHRVIAIGESPSVEAPLGAIFPLERTSEIDALVEALEGRGRPLAIWLADPALRAPEQGRVIVVGGADGAPLPIGE